MSENNASGSPHTADCFCFFFRCRRFFLFMAAENDLQSNVRLKVHHMRKDATSAAEPSEVSTSSLGQVRRRSDANRKGRFLRECIPANQAAPPSVPQLHWLCIRVNFGDRNASDILRAVNVSFAYEIVTAVFHDTDLDLHTRTSASSPARSARSVQISTHLCAGRYSHGGSKEMQHQSVAVTSMQRIRPVQP